MENTTRVGTDLLRLILHSWTASLLKDVPVCHMSPPKEVKFPAPMNRSQGGPHLMGLLLLARLDFCSSFCVHRYSFLVVRSIVTSKSPYGG